MPSDSPWEQTTIFTHLQLSNRQAVPHVVVDCGPEDWALAAADWFNGPGLDLSFRRGNTHWAYFSDEQFAGFACLGDVDWSKSNLGRCQIIPMLAVLQEHQHHGLGRYIVKHLIQEAQLRRPPHGLGLLVHSNNGRASRLYEAFGFQSIGEEYRNHQRMLLNLATSETSANP